MEPGSPTQAMSVMFSSAGIAPDVALDAGCIWISFKTGRNKGQAHNLIKQEQMGLNQHVFHPDRGGFTQDLLHQKSQGNLWQLF